MYHVEYMYMWFMSRPQGRAQGLTPKGKLFMGVSSMFDVHSRANYNSLSKDKCPATYPMCPPIF